MSNEATALQTTGGPQSTPMGIYQQPAPPQTAALATVVPLDRENLTFFANLIKACGLVPAPTKDANAEQQFNRAMGKIVAGTSYGFDPFLSQSCFDTMFGAMGLNAKGMGVLFRRSGEFDLRIDHHDEKGCKATVMRRFNGAWAPDLRQFTGGEWRAIGIVEFNEAMARTADLLKNPMYQKYPRDMYYARVITRAVKRYNPSCLMPIVTLGNYFARESQSNFLPPQPTAPAPQITENTNAPSIPQGYPTVDEDASDAEAVTTSEYEASRQVNADPDEKEVDGEVIDLTGEGEPLDTAESKRADLLTAVKELYVDLPKDAMKNADKWLGQRGIKDLSTEELSEFLSSFQE